MKKRVTSLFTGFLLVLAMTATVFAESGLTYVTDAADLLTYDQWQKLETNAEDIAERYDVGVYIITVDNISNYVEYADDAFEAAQIFYDYYELGETNENSGILLLLSMEERDWALCAYGYGNTAFTDYGREYLSGNFLDNFGENDWYGGFEDYQRLCGEMIASAREGNPVDVDNAPMPPHARLYGVFACILFGLIIAFIVRGILKGQLKSVAKETEAGSYVAGGLNLTGSYDHYTHTTESRVYSPTEKSSSSRSGGTTTNSSGYSGSSGKF